MFKVFLAVLVLAIAPLGAAAQQSPVWVQVEAQPTLSGAQSRARAFDAQLDNVAGYYIGSGWYGIVLGPYSRADADTLLGDLRRSGQIPSDSFIADGRNFSQQFWPIGVGAPTTAQPLPDNSAAQQSAIDIAQAIADTEILPDVFPREPAPIEAAPAEPTPITVPDETVQQARDSEASLTRGEKELLQTALKWAGFYESSIDGAFGRGTRASMGEWQAANNYEPTGVLTTRQRGVLISAYNAILDGMDMQLVRDDATGIELIIPTGVVAFDKYEPPFAQFEAKGDLAARVLLISQVGNQDRLFGLYEILQTLAIVPTDGPRSRRDQSFEIEGIGDGIHSYTTATLRNGQIKGFSLIWPAGDDARRVRVLDMMKASFTGIDGVLDPAIAAPDDSQAIDLVSGLSVRKPKLTSSGFFVDSQGDVLTTVASVGECSRITIDEVHDAQVIHTDEALGLAVIRPNAPLAPANVAQFQTGVPRLQSEIAVAGYPYGGVLTTPSLTFGRLADIRGLNGEDELKRLSLTAQRGDAGGPVFDNGGAVLGMLLPRTNKNGQQLPPEVNFSVDASRIVASLLLADVRLQTTDSVAFLPPEALNQTATDVTVLVSCW
ncbi:peptidoglycan hydrolase-like protein with peptidoglycan-binding domain [Loktanella ponticola]|uniref:Peptidoglycan hydrolase-like protein with peptidoglycan-binding domain n=1 Tax=Yoonia ponticola TaxID=1524255 RepID=A0A7W9EZ33_9RHOB|nr:trypsin-like peptidase domain-containing protein [Yoonia ponticola]MBB5723309.1 peptidoglycan hydrolase-like protein with peptidoglycan-binding domain [Yoonia ponticola]